MEIVVLQEGRTVRQIFDWYFRPSDAEIKSIWKSGTLTVDANVLLDLYRYHQTTRDSLIQTLKKFGGKKWLSRQACEEFFRNRTRVIVDANGKFKEAQTELTNLTTQMSSATQRLRGNRIIPTSISNSLENDINNSLIAARQAVESAEGNHPQFLKIDTVLDDLCAIFDGAVGPVFSPEEMGEVRKEAERRQKEQIPPGYLDDEKDNDRPYGDYIMWKQVLDYAKSQKTDVIFVTSERKEDWWERCSGKTIGPRPELLREAKLCSGQRILIYQTEHFLEFAHQRLDQPVQSSPSDSIREILDEIREISDERSNPQAAVTLLAQNVHSASNVVNAGQLLLELKRPVWNFTVSGHLDPNLKRPPSILAKVISWPNDTPDFKVGAGSGTVYDFNIHVICRGSGLRLSPGVYVIEYEATCALHSWTITPEPEALSDTSNTTDLRGLDALPRGLPNQGSD